MNIGFFDSGIGGLTVLKEAIKILPDENYLYYADTKNVPYGTKSSKEVIKLVNDAVDFLAKQKIKALVIACNTATSIAINELRKQYSFPIIGMEPAVKPAVINSGDKRILVTATSLTLKEEKLERLLAEIDKKKIVDKLPMDKLVGFAESFNFIGPEIDSYFSRLLKEYNFANYEAVVLGCTHFIYYEDILKNFIGRENVKIINGNEGTIRRLVSILQENNLFNYEKGGKVIYFNSGELESDKERINKMNDIIFS